MTRPLPWAAPIVVPGVCAAIAPALRRACGIDIVEVGIERLTLLASADLVLLTSDLGRLGTLVRLSRACRRPVAINVGLGLGWTLMALAAMGALGAEGAVVAAVLHNLSTFAGLTNSGPLLLLDETEAATKSSGRSGCR